MAADKSRRVLIGWFAFAALLPAAAASAEDVDDEEESSSAIEADDLSDEEESGSGGEAEELSDEEEPASAREADDEVKPESGSAGEADDVVEKASLGTGGVESPSRFSFGIEALGTVPADRTNRDLYGAGVGGSLGLEYNINPTFGLHAGVGAVYVSADQAMTSSEWVEGHVGPRIHWGILAFEPTTRHDGWADAHVSFGSSGGIKRSGFDVGAGLEFAVDDGVRIGPLVRYQFGSDPIGNHAQLLTIGVSLGLGGGSRVPIMHPAPDRDGDGIADVDDRCKRVPAGDKPDPRRLGCPLRDLDDDGILDDDDQCPEEAAGRTPDPARRGCPYLDTDGDQISDADDACPKEAGAPNSDPEKHGCPGLVRLSGDRLEILEQVFFETGSAAILPVSFAVLEAVKEAITALGVKRMRIEGHTDERGSSEFNMDLSQRRARSVATWLIQNGIDSDMLDVEGFGKTRPIMADKTEEAMSMNRRVEFYILK